MQVSSATVHHIGDMSENSASASSFSYLIGCRTSNKLMKMRLAHGGTTIVMNTFTSNSSSISAIHKHRFCINFFVFILNQLPCIKKTDEDAISTAVRRLRWTHLLVTQAALVQFGRTSPSARGSMISTHPTTRSNATKPARLRGQVRTSDLVGGPMYRT